MSRNSTYNMIGRFMAFVLIILLLPVYLVLGLLILVFSGWPVLFIQKRVGEKGKVFDLYKFRSMIQGADKMQKEYKKYNEADGPVFKIHNDPRLTRIGRFLFHTGLDELPQLFNIVKGEMDLIGPRPLPVDEECKIKDEYRTLRRSAKPGIISPWIFNGYHKLKFDEWMKCDIAYIKNKSFINDLVLIIKGIFFLVRLIFIEVFDLLTGKLRDD